MTQQEQIQEDIKTAMKNKDTLSLTVLRQLKSAISNFALQSGNMNNPVSDNDVMNIIRKQVKQREDSIEQFKKGERFDLAANEQDERLTLLKYLPKELDEASIDAIVAQAITDTLAVTKKDMGKAIKRAVELAKGQVDNKTLSLKIGAALP